MIAIGSPLRDSHLSVCRKESKQDAEGLKACQVNFLVLWHEPPIVFQHALKGRPAQLV